MKCGGRFFIASIKNPVFSTGHLPGSIRNDNNLFPWETADLIWSYIIIIFFEIEGTNLISLFQ